MLDCIFVDSRLFNQNSCPLRNLNAFSILAIVSCILLTHPVLVLFADFMIFQLSWSMQRHVTKLTINRSSVHGMRENFRLTLYDLELLWQRASQSRGLVGNYKYLPETELH